MSLSSGFLSAGFCYTQKIEHWFLYGLFAFFSTIAVYNGQRLFKAIESKDKAWLLWVRNHRFLLLFLVAISSILSIILFFILDKQIQIVYPLFAFVSIVSILYVVRIKGRNMRELPYIKIHLIAVSWVIVLILFPLINEEWDSFRMGYAFAFYLYVLAMTIPFDIRDVKYDHINQKTIPQLIGIMNAKILSVFFLLAFFLLIIVLDPRLTLNVYFILSVILQFVLLLLMNEKRGDFYCAGLIDGAIGLMGLSFFLI